MMNNYTTYCNLEKIKHNLIDVFADALRRDEKLQVKYPEHSDRIEALERFIINIAKIKNLAILSKMRKRYAK